MIESALLWYTLYTKELQKEGFELNEYDKCVANKIINGKQCTLAFYVDNNMLSHVETAVVDGILDIIEGYFPGLVVERGKRLNFLGMEIEFIKDGKVEIGVVQYLKGMFEEFELLTGEKLVRTYTSPGAKWLMTVDEKAKPLDAQKTEFYAKFVAKVLWVMKRGRPYIEPTVSFLCTRVKGPDCKLKRLLCWTKQTVEDVRIIGADNLLDMLTFIDSAHAVHPDMRRHTGGATTFGTGIIDQKSSKQKMNTRSSTESEVVGNSEYLPKNIYFEMFMEAQGYKLRSNTLAQDNQSTMRMATNGKSSCTSNSKHISIKYFWVTDRVKNGNIEVVHCPTRQMMADYFSKPLQGELLHLFCNVIMGEVLRNVQKNIE